LDFSSNETLLIVIFSKNSGVIIILNYAIIA